ncbi:MAG: cation transporter [Rhizobiaceae bacterium]
MFAIVVDVQIGVILIIGAIVSGSYTLIGENVRGWLILSAVCFSFWVQFANNRNWLCCYEFGAFKLEQLAWLVLGLAMLIAAPLLLVSVLNAVLSQHVPAAPVELTIGALVNALNLLLNVVGWFALLLASSDHSSDAFKAQFFARTTIVTSCAFVQLALTGAVLAENASVALLFDAIGALFVVCVMIFNGSKMVARSLPDLLDAPAKTEVVRTIKKVIAESKLRGQICEMRTRRLAAISIAELSLPASELLRDKNGECRKPALEAMEHELHQHGAEVELKFVARLRPRDMLGEAA